MDCSLPGSSPWDFPGNNAGVGCHFLHQGLVPNPGRESASPAWQEDSLPPSCLGSPITHTHASLLFQVLFPFRLLHNIEQSSLCPAVGLTSFLTDEGTKSQQGSGLTVQSSGSGPNCRTPGPSFNHRSLLTPSHTEDSDSRKETGQGVRARSARRLASRLTPWTPRPSPSCSGSILPAPPPRVSSRDLQQPRGMPFSGSPRILLSAEPAARPATHPSRSTQTTWPARLG